MGTIFTALVMRGDELLATVHLGKDYELSQWFCWQRRPPMPSWILVDGRPSDSEQTAMWREQWEFPLIYLPEQFEMSEVIARARCHVLLTRLQVAASEPRQLQQRWLLHAVVREMLCWAPHETWVYLHASS